MLRKPHSPAYFRHNVCIKGRYTKNGGTPQKELPVQNSGDDLLNTITKTWLSKNWNRRRADIKGRSNRMAVGEKVG